MATFQKDMLESMTQTERPKKHSAYTLFSRYLRAQNEEKYATLSWGEIVQEIGAGWKHSTEEEKAPFRAQAEKEKEAYILSKRTK